MVLRWFCDGLLIGFLSLSYSFVHAQSATITSTSIFCETANSTPDKYVSWAGIWSDVDEYYKVVGCYAPVYGAQSPATYYSPGPAIQTSPWGQPAPTYNPGSSSGAESPIVPISGPDGGTLQGVYVWFEYGNWVPYNGHYYWMPEGVLCDWVWVSNPGGSCFAAGTKVLTPTGFKPIENLKAGEEVISSDENPLSRNRTVRTVRTVRTIRGVSELAGELIEIASNGRKIRTTLNHPVLTKSRGWVAAAALRVGDELMGDTSRCSVVESIKIGDAPAKSRVYNVEIDGESSYFVGDSDWGFSICVADSCNVPSSVRERLAFHSRQRSLTGRSPSIEQVLNARFEMSVGR